ncbi:MAG TPA: glycerophosphodiester phosphodiesterase [Ignavibacteriaceae bacterium]|nr:glycerophosphodiester phosphodiesterase [Ignavibacteriaceae bacterium]
MHLPTEPELYVDDKYTVQLSDSSKSAMNGVYAVDSGKDLLGEEVVGIWKDRKWCMYAKHDVHFSECAGGPIGDLIEINGYIRIVRSGSGQNLNLTISPEEGATDLIQGIIPEEITIRGKASDGTDIVLRKIRSINNNSPADFYVIAHRGGGRNSERLGKSENSLEMIRYAEILGANGVEIDVKRTRDGHLIVFHDDTFSPRTVQGTYLLGKVENFDLEQIKIFGQLVYGESIPTLDEALSTIIDETKLSLIWIDLKDPEIVDAVILAQQNAINYASSIGRNIKILIGIPTDEILNAYNSSDYKNTTPTLVELDANTAKSLQTCEAWAPRWTNGTPSQSLLGEMHSRNILVFTWTLDVRDYINDFLDAKVDGILSNYPSLVAGMYYSQ